VELYLIRHADAIDADAGMTDEERPLSEEGREKMRKGAKGLRKLLSGSFPPLDGILTSPLLRSVETAQIIALEVNDNQDVTECPPLAEESRWADILPFLSNFQKSSRIALIGHEPELGKLAGWLISRSPDTAIPMKKGSTFCFEIEEAVPDPKAELLWFLTPKMLRQLR
jgi:phosphohistidine phosphatase